MTSPLREQIDALATEAKATVTTNTFDGGLVFIITAPGVGTVRVTAEWGDDEDAVLDLLRSRMTAAGMFAVKHEYLLDYGSGNTARIWAPSERQAVRMAMRGEPESITDLTTGEVMAWATLR